MNDEHDYNLEDFFDVIDGLRFKYAALLRLIGEDADVVFDDDATIAPTDGRILGTVIDTDNTGDVTVALQSRLSDN